MEMVYDNSRIYTESPQKSLLRKHCRADSNITTETLDRLLGKVLTADVLIVILLFPFLLFI